MALLWGPTLAKVPHLTAFRGIERGLCEGFVFTLISALLIEFVGTFLLCFTVATAAAPSNSQLGHNGDPLASLSIGTCLMVAIFSGGYISGGAYNPAVSLGIMVRFVMEDMSCILKEAGICIAYIGVQVTAT